MNRMKLSRKRCYLCNMKQCDTGRTFFRFPKDSDLRSKWKVVCKLTDRDDVKSLAICSGHFEEKDFDKTSAVNIRGIQKLIRNAVPLQPKRNKDGTIQIPKKLPPRIQLTQDIANSQIVDKCEQTIQIDGAHIETMLDRTNTETVSNSSAMQCLENSSVVVHLAQNEDEHIEDILDGDNSTQCNWMLVEGGKGEDVNLVQNSVAHTDHSYTILQVQVPENKKSKKRRYCDPRYVGEIELADFATPRQAKRCMELIKTTVQKQKNKIKQLQTKNKRLEKKIVALVELLGEQPGKIQLLRDGNH